MALKLCNKKAVLTLHRDLRKCAHNFKVDPYFHAEYQY